MEGEHADDILCDNKVLDQDVVIVIGRKGV